MVVTWFLLKKVSSMSSSYCSRSSLPVLFRVVEGVYIYIYFLKTIRPTSIKCLPSTSQISQLTVSRQNFFFVLIFEGGLFSQGLWPWLNGHIELFRLILLSSKGIPLVSAPNLLSWPQDCAFWTLCEKDWWNKNSHFPLSSLICAKSMQLWSSDIRELESVL